MREDWVAYVVVLTVVGFMLLGKKMIFFSGPIVTEKELEEEVIAEVVIAETIVEDNSEIKETPKC